MGAIISNSDNVEQTKALIIKKEYISAKDHEAIELYIAAQRTKGRKLLKPAAAVELIRKGLGNFEND